MVLGADYGNVCDLVLRGSIDSVLYTPDARRILTGGIPITVWDSESSEYLMELQDIPGEAGQSRSVCFLPGQRLLATNDNGSIYVFETAPTPR